MILQRQQHKKKNNNNKEEQDQWPCMHVLLQQKIFALLLLLFLALIDMEGRSASLVTDGNSNRCRRLCDPDCESPIVEARKSSSDCRTVDASDSSSVVVTRKSGQGWSSINAAEDGFVKWMESLRSRPRRVPVPESMKLVEYYNMMERTTKSGVASGIPFSRNETHGNHAQLLPVMIGVDKWGYSNFSTVQAAIDAVPPNNKRRVIIFISPGIYEERVEIPSNKPFITFQGAGRSVTLITGNSAARDWKREFSSAQGTYHSCVVGVNADHFIARNISFQNTAPHPVPGAAGWQAVAFRATGDFAAFYGCGFYGAQDTLYDHKGRHYFHDCYIEGSIDFVFGRGQSLYVGCTLHSIDNYGSLTAQKRSDSKDRSGFSFVNCTVTGSSPHLLGRAWGPYSRVVYAYTYMENSIIPFGWSNWNDAYREETVYYGQYKCYGPGANENARVAWSHELADEEAQPFLNLSFIDGQVWLPYQEQIHFLELQAYLEKTKP